MGRLFFCGIWLLVFCGLSQVAKTQQQPADKRLFYSPLKEADSTTKKNKRNRIKNQDTHFEKAYRGPANYIEDSIITRASSWALQNGYGIGVCDSMYALYEVCKGHVLRPVGLTRGEAVFLPGLPTVKETPPPFLQIHGNILYELSYRSYLDTPFVETNLLQHRVQTNLHLLIREKYPLQITISNRSSNSSYFRDATDVSLQFNRRQLLDNIKTDLRNKVKGLVNVERLTELEQQYKNRLGQVQQLQQWLDNPARMQEVVQEKEQQLRQRAKAKTEPAAITHRIGKELVRQIVKEQPGLPEKLKNTYDNVNALPVADKINSRKNALADSLIASGKDSLQAIKEVRDSSTHEKINARKQQLKELETRLKTEAAQLVKAKKQVADSIAQLKKELNSLNNPDGLYAWMKKQGISKDSLTRAQRLLLSVSKIGIGRSWVDYSELTVKNVSLTGINIEMTPAPYYIAVAAGKLNYRFRDFILKERSTASNQSLWLVRGGIGQPEKNNLILSIYNGRKEMLGGSASAIHGILGVSAETRLALDPNNFIVAEVAKSSYNGSGSTQPASSSLWQKAFDWKTSTNLAYHIRLFSHHPATGTRITGYYRKMGKNFQSFNLYPTGAEQEAWMLRINQAFWKKRLTVDAAIRKNDFNNALPLSSFNSRTIFKSLQLTLRVPRYPFISLGYYPSSQLSVGNGRVLTESQFNTLNATVGHSYTMKRVSMSTNATYTRFYNNSADTGFIYFNATSWTVSHSLFFDNLQLQSTLGYTKQSRLCLLMLEQTAGYRIKEWMTVTGGLKWNKQNSREVFWGGTAGLGVSIKKIGTIQCNYDKTYLPGYGNRLTPVDIGRMSFYRVF